MVRLCLAALFLVSGFAQAQTLTWSYYSLTAPAYTFSIGQFSTPVSSVSVDVSSQGIAAFMDAFNASGQGVGSCLEYQGSIHMTGNYFGCVTAVAPNVYQFSFTDATNDIAQVVAGSYAPMGPVSDVTYAAPAPSAGPVGVPEPSTFALMAAGLL